MSKKRFPFKFELIFVKNLVIESKIKDYEAIFAGLLTHKHKIWSKSQQTQTGSQIHKHVEARAHILSNNYSTNEDNELTGSESHMLTDMLTLDHWLMMQIRPCINSHALSIHEK